MRRKPWLIRLWEKGEYLDFWSFIYFINGLFLLGTFFFIGFNFFSAFVVALIAVLMWESLEPKQAIANKIFDILVGALGLFIMYLAYSKVLFIVVAILAIPLNIWAWVVTKNYKKL